MPNPCPTCAANSAWGCPQHAPKHMEAGRKPADADPLPEVVKCRTFLQAAHLWGEMQNKAALWDEVKPLLLKWHEMLVTTSFPAERTLDRFAADHESDLEAL